MCVCVCVCAALPQLCGGGLLFCTCMSVRDKESTLLEPKFDLNRKFVQQHLGFLSGLTLCVYVLYSVKLQYNIIYDGW